MKKFMVALLSLSIFLSLIACGAQPQENSSEKVISNAENTELDEIEPTEQSNTVNYYHKIKIEMEVDKSAYQGIVTITNESPTIISGKIMLNLLNGNNKKVGKDILTINKLPPSECNIVKINISQVENIRLDYKIMNNFSFTPVQDLNEGTLNIELSNSISIAYENTYGGVENPKSTANWYSYLIKIEVFTDDNGNYAVVTVKDDIDENSIELLGDTIFTAYRYDNTYNNDFKLKRVSIITESDKVVYDKEV